MQILFRTGACCTDKGMFLAFEATLVGIFVHGIMDFGRICVVSSFDLKFANEGEFLMIKKIGSVCITASLVLAMLAGSALSANAVVVDGQNSGATAVVNAVGSDEYWYEINDDGKTVTITRYMGDDTVLVLPSTIDGMKVTAIAEHAFSYCEVSITSVTVPEGVTEIASFTFSGCSALTDISLPSSLKSIGEQVFYNCTSLESVTIPDGVEKLGDYFFKGCTRLTSVKIPNSVTEIGMYAFGDCKSLTSVTLPNQLTMINDGLFQECTSLKEVTIPGSVTAINEFSFYKCTSLEKVVIQEGVTSIEWSAFRQCPALTSVTIPRSVEKIYSDTFLGSDNVTIYGYKDTYAEEYARKWFIPFVALDDDKTDPATTKIYGDLSNDGRATSVDALVILRYLSNIVDLTEEQKIAADVDGNGKVSTTDALYILRYVARLDSAENIGKEIKE